MTPLAHILATLAAVVAAGLVLGRLMRAVGQPPVLGEVLAGILLGPSLLGAVWPQAASLLKPAAVEPVAQLGVILYLFLVGLELDAGHFAGRLGTAATLSAAGIVVPFALGVGLGLLLHAGYAPAGVSATVFALFLGVSLAVTAFPVLARILSDRHLDKTPLGTLALGAAAIGDVAAWGLLALVVGIARAEVGSAAFVLIGAAAFAAVMLLVVRPLLWKASRWLDARPGPLPPAAVAGTFLGVLLSALATEAIGVHALFGAFLFGAVLPHDGRLAREFAATLTAPVTVLLLPAFFASSGMKTQIGLLGGTADWLWCGLIVLAATAGKVGGTMAAARLTRHSWRDSAALGALMNTRGLMELIVLNVGLELGVIGPATFAMLVLMALATTAATAPALAWLGVGGRSKIAAGPAVLIHPPLTPAGLA